MSEGSEFENVCTHEFSSRRWSVCECDWIASRRTWSEQQVFHHETVIGPETRIVEWLELIDTTGPGDTSRTWNVGRHFARLVIPIPDWLADLFHRVGIR